jgi:hypothetical protein
LLRRITVQSLHKSVAARNRLRAFHQVASKEADLNFARFLGDALEKWCGW